MVKKSRDVNLIVPDINTDPIISVYTGLIFVNAITLIEKKLLFIRLALGKLFAITVNNEGF